MTIFKPEKKSTNSLTVISLSCLLAIVILGWLFLYNKEVSFEHEITKKQKDIKEAEVANAEFKNKLFSVLDPKNLKNIAIERNLVTDSNPKYLEIAHQ